MSSSSPFASYQGRITRSTFWLYVLPFLAVSLFAGLIDMVFQASANSGVCSLVVAICVAIPVWRLCLRRGHDRNRPAFLTFLLLVLSGIPLVGFLVTLWLFVDLGLLRGTAGANKYGADPTLERLPA